MNKQNLRKTLMGLLIIIAALGVGITAAPIPKNNREEFQLEVNDENDEIENFQNEVN